ncbi:hypothetical protein BDZ85DRAFT_256743 [Elsinoe ampelina]|uniref:Short-chain dehydrogenases/reductase n=1 Tax=Elsinoe ampelina TaxID=302913 RepID=A0A6A6GMN4_9PEZI|nr:hypothetical protein BDZ85DRAFT_256743 [Elsinoe ampelina]
MVSYDKIREANAALVASQPLVAVFFGGATGIGSYVFAQLAATHGTTGRGLRAYIVGRNAQAAAANIAEARRVCPEGSFHFVQAKDLALLRDVDEACAEVERLERDNAGRDSVVGGPRIDLLYMSQALFGWPPRTDTDEGLGYQMSLLYYSRARCVWQLRPLLLASKLPAHIVSIFAAGLERDLDANDLSLRDTTSYGQVKLRNHTMYIMTFFFEEMARQNAGRMSLSNVFPGLVMTNAFYNDILPGWFKLLWTLLQPITRLVAFSSAECGQRMLFMATPHFPAKRETPDSNAVLGTDNVRGSGSYSVQQDSEITAEKKMTQKYQDVRAKGLAKKCWDHTMDAFQTIESGKRFTG